MRHPLSPYPALNCPALQWRVVERLAKLYDDLLQYRRDMTAYQQQYASYQARTRPLSTHARRPRCFVCRLQPAQPHNMHAHADVKPQPQPLSAQTALPASCLPVSCCSMA